MNLRGQEFRQAGKVTLPIIGERRRPTITDYSYNDFPPNRIQLPPLQSSRPVFEVDYSLAPGSNVPAQRIPSPGIVNLNYAQQYARYIPRSVDPSTPITLDDSRGNGSSFRGPAVVAYDTYAQLRDLDTHDSQYTPDDYSIHSSPAHTRSGYTAAEELIIHAHAESRRHPASLDIVHRGRNRREDGIGAASVNITTAARGYRTRAINTTLGRNGQSSSLAEMESTPMMSENEFHATAARGYENKSMQNAGEEDPDVTLRGNSRDYSSCNDQTIRSTPRTFTTPVLGTQPQLASTAISEQHNNQHIRCTTFPYRPPPSQHQRHQHHSSMNIPSTGQRTPQHAATAVMSQNNPDHDKRDYQDSVEKRAVRREIGNKLHSKFQHAPNVGLHQNAYDMDNQPSPSLISPTLTYSSQTPSTLSPATPFFGSFSSQNEAFGLDGHKFRVSGS